jgi:hypothetical protein
MEAVYSSETLSFSQNATLRPEHYCTRIAVETLNAAPESVDFHTSKSVAHHILQSGKSQLQ